jgi:hypothetical protein
MCPGNRVPISNSIVWVPLKSRNPWSRGSQRRGALNENVRMIGFQITFRSARYNPASRVSDTSVEARIGRVS